MRKVLKTIRALIIVVAFTIAYLIIGGAEQGAIKADQEPYCLLILALSTACFLLLIQITDIVTRYKKAQKRMTWTDYQSTRSFDESDYDR